MNRRELFKLAAAAVVVGKMPPASAAVYPLPEIYVMSEYSIADRALVVSAMCHDPVLGGGFTCSTYITEKDIVELGWPEPFPHSKLVELIKAKQKLCEQDLISGLKQERARRLTTVTPHRRP